MHELVLYNELKEEMDIRLNELTICVACMRSCLNNALIFVDLNFV